MSSDLIAAHEFQREIILFVEQGLWAGRRQFGPSSAMGWATEAEGLVAGFVYSEWDPDHGTVEVSGYSTRRDWCTPTILRELFGYPFDQLGCRLVCARHSARNARVRRIWRALGAAEVILPRMRGDDEDEAVALLHRDDWRGSRFARREGPDH